MAEAIYLSKVRLSFPKLIEASASKDFPNAAKRFSCDLILTPNHPDFAKVMGEVGNAANARWKENAGNILKMIQNDKRLRFFGSGNEKVNGKTFKVYDGYEGNNYITCSSDENHPPQMIRPDGTICDNGNTMERQALARKLYGGCYVNAAIRPWIQDNQFGRAVRCELIGVQFCADGDSFGEAPPDLSSMFGQVAGAAESPFPSFMS